jgi:hypothetical protein
MGLKAREHMGLKPLKLGAIQTFPALSCLSEYFVTAAKSLTNMKPKSGPVASV